MKDIEYIDCSISKELQEFLDFRDEIMKEFYIFANKILMIPKEYFDENSNLPKV